MPPYKIVPKFAVLLAAYNGMKFINEQLSSILAQVDVNLHIYVSVDSSTDGTEFYVERLATTNPRVTLLSIGGCYGGAAKNFYRLMSEVDFSTYDLICFSDQDDIWLPQKLSRALEMLTSTNADAYSSNVIAFWADGRRSLIVKSQPQVEWDFLFEAAGPGCTYVITKKLALDFQALIKTRWYEVHEVDLHDWFIYAFARANGYNWFIDEIPGMLYRQHDANQVGVNVGIKAFHYRSKQFLNGWLFQQSALIAKLVGFDMRSVEELFFDGSRFRFLALTLLARRCRRRMRDQLFFSITCLAMSLIRHKRR